MCSEELESFVEFILGVCALEFHKVLRENIARTTLQHRIDYIPAEYLQEPPLATIPPLFGSFPQHSSTLY